MVFTLQFPEKPIPILVQDLLKNNWPTTPDPDPVKLQTTNDKIDWGYDYDDQTTSRVTIKAVSMEAESSGDTSEFNRRVKRQQLGGTVVVRVQYRDADDEQPRELWNIGREIQGLVFKHMFALRNDGVEDIKSGRFRVAYKIPDHPELHEWEQNIRVFFATTGIES